MYIECPLAEFYKLSGKYQLRIGFVFKNGSRVTKSYEYEFVNNIPNIEVINTRALLNRAGWSVVSADSEEDNGPASDLLDGDVSTFWHTEWKSTLPGHPHYFVLDMGGFNNSKRICF